MEFVTVNVEDRPKVSKGTNHQLRKAHKIPGVVYGRNTSSKTVAFREFELLGVIREQGSHALMQFDLGDGAVYGRIKDLQKDSVNGSILHVDIQQIDADQKIEAIVPIVLVGTEIAESQGAIIQRQLSEVKVSCYPTKQPRFIEAFVGQLETGQRFKVQDLEVAEELSILSDPEDVIAILSTNRLDPADFEEVHVVGEMDSKEKPPPEEKK